MSGITERARPTLCRGLFSAPARSRECLQNQASAEGAEGPEQKVVLLAAQPIFDRQHRVKGVELLYRNEAQQTAIEVGEDRATAELLFNFCTGVSEQADQFRAPAFINVTASFLQSRSFLPIDPDKVVIELVERIEPTPELVQCIRDWRRHGFRFALDDFEFNDSWRPILRHASIIKVDVAQIGYEEVLQRKQEKLNPSGLQLFRLLEEFSRVEQEQSATGSDLDRLVDIISSDPHLVVKLLKIANSAFYRSATKIANIHQLILRFGLSNLRKWVMLFGLLRSSTIENVRLVLIRAGVCERLEAQRFAHSEAGRGYLTGLLTGVTLLYRVELTQFIQQVPLDDCIRTAILFEQGELGQLVSEVLEAECRLTQQMGIEQIDPEVLQAFQQAHEEVSNLLGGVCAQE